ncbi:MAG: hypothetical protein ABW184_01305 [Sphingobium sp.]
MTGLPARLAAAAAMADATQDEAQAVAALRPLFQDIGWLTEMAAKAATALAADPLHSFGINASTSGALQQMVLASGPRISVTLCAFSGGGGDAPPRPSAHAFAGHRSLLRIVSRDPLDGRLAIMSRRTGLCRDRAVRLPPGRTFDLDERRRALWVSPPDRQALFLRARIARRPSPLIASYALGQSEPQSLANGDDGLARSLAMVAVLRALGHAPPVCSLRALLPRAHGAQRWTLMREMLAADTAAAWPDLSAMARTEPDSAVRAAARRLIDRIAPCPA